MKVYDFQQSNLWTWLSFRWLIIYHQAILRSLYAYFADKPLKEAPHVEVSFLSFRLFSSLLFLLVPLTAASSEFACKQFVFLLDKNFNHLVTHLHIKIQKYAFEVPSK